MLSGSSYYELGGVCGRGLVGDVLFDLARGRCGVCASLVKKKKTGRLPCGGSCGAERRSGVLWGSGPIVWLWSWVVGGWRFLWGGARRPPGPRPAAVLGFVRFCVAVCRPISFWLWVPCGLLFGWSCGYLASLRRQETLCGWVAFVAVAFSL